MIPVTDLAGLRAFVAIAEARSFSRAADGLGVSPSALSQTLRGLEQRLGARLLDRTTRSVSLTEAGAALLAQASPALDALGRAVGEAQRSGGRAGTLRIQSFRLAAELFVYPILGVLHRDHPDLVLDLTIDDAVSDPVAGGFDAAIRVGEVVERDMVAVRLGDELRQLAVASPAYLAENGSPEAPLDLLGHRCLRWRWPGHAAPYDWEFFGDGRWFTVRVDGPLIANSRDATIHAAVAGAGIAFATDVAVAPLIAQGLLVPLLERWSARFPGFTLCYPLQRHMRPALRVFIDVVRAGGRDPPASRGLADGAL